MKYAKKMLMGAFVLPLSVLSVGGSSVAGCAAPSTESVDGAAAGTDLTSPARLEQWLHEQCPDGSVLRITTETDVQDTACESVRERVLADPTMHELFVTAYAAQGSTGGERVGEAREPLVFGPFVCAFMALLPGVLFNVGPTGQAGCHNPRLSHEEQARCSNITEGGSAGLGLACAVVTIFF